MGNNVDKIVVVGASAGGFSALAKIFADLPENSNLAIVCVLHLHRDGKLSPADLLQRYMKVKIKEAESTEKIKRGTVYIAPADYHLSVERNGTFSLSCEAPVMYSRPSIDVLFNSAAMAFGANVTGIVMTGANSDGAVGLKNIVERGGSAVVQDPDDAEQRTMPAEALALVPNAEVLSLAGIARYLVNLNEACTYSRV